VYSLACIIYTMLSGAHPFDSRSAVEARSLALSMKPLLVLSREQNAAIARGLAFEGAQRTASVTDLLAELGWMPDQPVASAPAPVASAPAPVASTPAPVASAPAPVASTPAEVVSAPAPIASTPAEVVSAPAQVVSAPAEVVSAPAESVPLTAPRVARRIGFRLPLPPIEPSAHLPSMDLPSIRATSQALPQKRSSRRYILPALILLALMALGIAIALFSRGHAPSVAQSQTASNPAPVSAPVAPSDAPPVASSATAGSTSAPAAGPIAPPVASQTTNPPAVANTTSLSTVQTGPHLAMLRPLPKAAAEMANNDNCPYPRTAVDQGLTGTVFLVVHLTSDGKPMTTKMGRTSGSDVLDQAAVRCVEQFGRFPPAPAESPEGYWGFVRFRWFVDI
jgi:TonB family protein